VQPAAATPTAEAPMQGALPIVADPFGTITRVQREEIARSPSSTLGDLLFAKPGITGSSFAPGASSRPIIRGLDSNRVRVQENGVGANGASDLGEDHFVPVDPVVSDRVEVIRGPAALRYGSQAIGGVVEATDNRIPMALPCAPASSPPISRNSTATAAASTLAPTAPMANRFLVMALTSRRRSRRRWSPRRRRTKGTARSRRREATTGPIG
jgi:outer membrane receptor protein involved in Fe transport